MVGAVRGRIPNSLDVDPLVDLAVTLRNQMPRRLDERFGGGHEEEIALQDALGGRELLLRLLEVKVDVERAHKVGDGVAVFVPFLPDHSHEVLELLLVLARVAAAAAVRDDRGGQVAQHPGAVGLDGVDEGRLEEQVGERLARGLVVEEGEEGPVDEPGAVLQLRERVVEQLGVDRLLDFRDLLHGHVPVEREDVAGQLAPGGRADLVGVGRQDAELVEQVRGVGVVAAVVLEAAVGVQHVDHGARHAVLLLQELQVGHLVAAQVRHNALVVQQRVDPARLLGEVLQLRQHLLAFAVELLGHVVAVVDLLPQVGDIVGHVGRLEQRILGLEDPLRALFLLAGEEFEEGEYQMAVKVGN